MNDVIVVQVQQSVRDLQRIITSLFVSDVLLAIKNNVVETSATAELEHNARIGSIETHSECLDEIRMWCYSAELMLVTGTKHNKYCGLRLTVSVWLHQGIHQYQ